MLAQGAAAQAQGQAVLNWLSNKDNEHKIGIALDVLGIVNFVIMCIPVVGEADMGLMAVGTAAREVLLTRTGMFATAVAGGAALGATVDGRYLQLRYMSDGNAQERMEKAEKWDDSKLATGMSIAAAILTLADFSIGGALTIHDLRNMSKETQEMMELSKSAAESERKLGLSEA
ncbi:hypothetical protein [Acidocella sp.]|uniref:hypothetical protein n=1 Tax=Acidocella sp. TaxID=50710 RepID=UPI003D01B513